MQGENYTRKLLGLGSAGSSKSEKPEGKPMNPNPWNRQGKRDRQPDGKNRQDKNGRNDKRQKTGDKAGSCKGCGRSPHPDGKCPFLVFGHPDANKSDKTWDKSDSGIAWLQRKQPSCPFNHTLSGETFHMSSKMREMRKKGERQGILFSFTSSSHALHVEGAALKCGIMTNPNNSNREAINSNREVSALVDTGSLNLNLITSSTADWLVQAGAKKVKGERYWRLHTPCGKSSLLKMELDFCLVIYNKLTNSNELIDITAVVIDDEMLPV